jgi:hypothetical protein
LTRLLSALALSYNNQEARGEKNSGFVWLLVYLEKREKQFQ